MYVCMYVYIYYVCAHVYIMYVCMNACIYVCNKVNRNNLTTMLAVFRWRLKADLYSLVFQYEASDDRFSNAFFTP